MSLESPGRAALALLHEGWTHLREGRPLAARACWRRAALQEEGAAAAQQAIATLESAPDLPAVARADHGLWPPSDETRREAWNDRLPGHTRPHHPGDRPGNGDAPGDEAADAAQARGMDLAVMADAFGRLANLDPADSAAWYNRALCLAWLGSNREAVSCLDRVVELEAGRAPDRAVLAWTLAALLRQGGGAQAIADDLRYHCTIDWDPADTEVLLLEFPELTRLPTPRVPGSSDAAPEMDILEWPDRPAYAGSGEPSTGAALPVALATIFIDRASRRLRLSSPRVETLQVAEERLLGRIGAGRAASAPEPRPRREASPLPLPFLDADVWTVRIPPGLEPAVAEELRREWVEHYYENLWIHRPRQALGGLTPLAAARHAHRGDSAMRARLMAVIDFREQLARRPSVLALYRGYPFDRLRRRLGLPPSDPAAPAADPADLSCAPAWELAALDPSALDDYRLADAVASASGLGDDEVTVPLAEELLRRGVPIAGVTLIGAVSPLVRRATAAASPDAALSQIDRARSMADAATVGTLDVWRAEILARFDRPDEAASVYRGLIRSDAAGAAIALDAALTLIDNQHLDQARPLLHRARDLARAFGRPWIARHAQALIDEMP